MECARAAVANGADAIYFGMPRFNARKPEFMKKMKEERQRGPTASPPAPPVPSVPVIDP